VGRNFLRLGIVVLFLASFAWSCWSILKIVTTTAPDFSVFWMASKDFLARKNLYSNPDLVYQLLQPPITLIFYIPVSLFFYRYAQAIFILLSFASIVGTALISLKITFDKIPWHYFLLVLSLALAAFPTKYSLGMGQVNTISLLILLSGFYFYLRRSYKIAGILLGLSIISKPIFGFLLLFFLLEHEWRVILYILSTLIGGFLLSIFVSNITLYKYWIEKVFPPLLGMGGREVYYNQGISGFISRLTHNLAVRGLATFLVSILVVGSSFFLAFKKNNKQLLFSLFLISLLLVDSLSWQHHFFWLIFPFVILANFAAALKKTWFWFLLGGAYLLIGWNFKNPELYQDFPKTLFLSNQFYGAVILWGLNVYLIFKKKKLHLYLD
jgi:hypothetical protein